jgi:hypothetical protein
MKYAKELDKILHDMNPWDRVFCINYKSWKSRFDKNWRVSIFIRLCMTPAKFMSLNIKTVYKICKRIQKRFGVQTQDFFNMVSKIFNSESRLTYYDKCPQDTTN